MGNSRSKFSSQSPDNNARPPVAILGVPFDNLTLDAAVARIEQIIAQRHPRCLVTANVDFAVQARKDVELHRILCDAHLVLCDGTPLVWASRLLGNPLPERVAGADLVPRLIEVAAQKGYRLFLLGATPDSAEAAVTRLLQQHPQLIIAGHYSPPFKRLLEMDHKEIRRRIRAARPDLLFVSFGCPKQEKWVAMHYRDLKVPVSIGVGATIDFLGGQVKRAPLWMQRTGTEWLFRLAQEPRRLFRRYTNDLRIFGWCLLAQYCRTMVRQSRLPPISHSESRAGSAVEPESTVQVLKLPSQLVCSTAPALMRMFDSALAECRNCVLDGSAVRAVDSTGIGLLLQFRRNLHALGFELVLVGASQRLRRLIEWMRLEPVFIRAPDIKSAELHLRNCSSELRVPASMPYGANEGELSWQGEITAANARIVWEQTRAFLVRLPPLRQYQLDLSKVRFIDSSGLGLMIRARKFARAHQKELLFTNPGAAVRNVLRLAKLEDLLIGAGGSAEQPGFSPLRAPANA